MTAIAKSAKTHPEAKKCVWEEPAIHFLAAMSSSRSDVVTQFVRSFVRPFVPFFSSFSVLGVLSSHKELQWRFKKVLRLFQV